MKGSLVKYSYTVLYYTGVGFEEKPVPVGVHISAKIPDAKLKNVLRNCASTGLTEELPLPDAPIHRFQLAHHQAFISGLRAAFTAFHQFMVDKPFFNAKHSREIATLIHPCSDAIDDYIYSWGEEQYKSAPGGTFEEFKQATNGILIAVFQHFDRTSQN